MNEILRIIKKYPMNRFQIRLELPINQSILDECISILYDQGLIHVHHYVKNAGQPTPYWLAGMGSTKRTGVRNIGIPKSRAQRTKELNEIKPLKQSTWLSILPSASSVDN